MSEISTHVPQKERGRGPTKSRAGAEKAGGVLRTVGSVVVETIRETVQQGNEAAAAEQAAAGRPQEAAVLQRLAQKDEDNVAVALPAVRKALQREGVPNLAGWKPPPVEKITPDPTVLAMHERAHEKYFREKPAGLDRR
jgi:hypothetical protein